VTFVGIVLPQEYQLGICKL